MASDRELAKKLIDKVPDGKMFYVVAYLQNILVADSDKIPNSETLAAFSELDNGGGHMFNGTTDELFKELLEE